MITRVGEKEIPTYAVFSSCQSLVILEVQRNKLRSLQGRIA